MVPNFPVFLPASSPPSAFPLYVSDIFKSSPVIFSSIPLLLHTYAVRSQPIRHPPRTSSDVCTTLSFAPFLLFSWGIL